MREDKGKIVCAVTLTLLASLFGILYGYLIGQATQTIIEKNMKMTLIYLGLYAFISIFCHFVLRRISSILFNKIRANLTRRIGTGIYYKTLLLPAKAFEEKKSGGIVNRIVNDTSTVTDLLNALLNMAIRVITCFIIYIYIWIQSWIVASEILIFVIITFFISRYFRVKIKNENKIIQKEIDKCILDVNQGVLGIREIKALGNRNIVYDNFSKLVNNAFDHKEELGKYEINYNESIASLNGFFETLVFLTCGLLIFFNMSTISFFMAMTYYVYQFIYLSETFTSMSTSYQKVIVSMERINEILDNKLYDDEKFGLINKKEINGEIEFRDVDFGYEKDRLMLKDFNLKIPANKKIAIVGKSGQGKTTLFNLLLRLFDPIQGEILIDNINIKDFTEENLRKHISIIRQDPYIFNKTILENFRLVNPNITLKDVRKYCMEASIDDYIMSLPEKYNTVIGEGGVNLSGGQKQRLAIARSLMKESKIILFDEATSALDNESQECIKQTIDKLSKNHTIVIIAHRLSTIKDADKIYLIDDGKIVASGKHDYLMKNNKMYKKLYNPEQLEINV